MASSKITWGRLLLAKVEGKSLPEGVAVDAEGNLTTNPIEAVKGGLLPIADHKGSEIAFIVEILAGALTNSRCGFDVEGGWGSFFILIDPNILRPIEEFKTDVESLKNEVKNSPKAPGIDEIFFPGERSGKAREKNLKAGNFEISEVLYGQLLEMIK